MSVRIVRLSSSLLYLLLPLFLTQVMLETGAAKILFNVPLTTLSEQNLYTAYVNALAARGHHVTTMCRRAVEYESKNVREIIPLNFTGYLDILGDGLEMRRMGWVGMFTMDPSFLEEGCRRVFQNPVFLQTLTAEKYDLIVTNNIFHQCLYAVMPKFQPQAPFILVSTMPLVGYAHDLTGVRVPTSFVPNSFFSTTDRMDFGERFFNTIMDYLFTVMNHLMGNPMMDKVAQEFLGQDIPSASEIERNASLIFSNTHVAVTPPRPLIPEIVEIGGLHCRPGKPLPKDLETFLEDSGPDGFILFSMGSLVKSHQMPLEYKKIFLKVFAGLKQRVLWKYETDDLPKEMIPPNVRLGKWLPQQDILAHKNIRLFMTHSGMFSTQEAAYHGVPLLGFPITVDQNLNIRRAVDSGYAIEMEILDLREDTLQNALTEMLTNKIYLENAKRISSIFRDQIQTPAERVVYWTEYVIRHKGADHLKSGARQLNFIQYHSLDVLAALFLLILTVIAIITCTLRKCFIRFTSSSKDRQKKKVQ